MNQYKTSNSENSGGGTAAACQRSLTSGAQMLTNTFTLIVLIKKIDNKSNPG